MDKYNIDSHKLMYHPDRVHEWIKTGDAWPIYMEVSPSGACNHRCKFCALDYLQYKPNYLDVASYVKFIQEMANSGLKSVMFGGEGESLMHKHFEELVAATQSRGIDCALTTNGVLLTPERAKHIVPLMKWIKVSVDAGTDITYGKMHSTSCKDWDVLWNNIKSLVENKGKCKIGLQFLLLEDNLYEVEEFIKKASAFNVDYAVIKVYSKNLKSKNNLPVKIYEKHGSYEYADRYNTDTFKVIIRRDKSERSYTRCLALPFWRYLQANGNLWSCSVHIGDDRFVLGNINQHTTEVMHWQANMNNIMMRTFDISNCRLNCRMNNCNEYLHRLKNPMEHDNFI